MEHFQATPSVQDSKLKAKKARETLLQPLQFLLLYRIVQLSQTAKTIQPEEPEYLVLTKTSTAYFKSSTLPLQNMRA